MKISIIVRAYNAEDTIERAMLSALNQDFDGNYEVIAVNDGSTDKTLSILEKFGSSRRVKIYSQQRKGGTGAAVAGWEKSQADYVTLLDSDDEFLPCCIRKLVQALDDCPEIDFVYPDYIEETGNNSSLISPENLFQAVSVGLGFRRTRFREAGYFSDGIFFAEYDFFLETFGKLKSMHLAGEPLFIYHRRYKSATSDKNRVKEGICQLKKRHPDKLDLISMIRSY